MPRPRSMGAGSGLGAALGKTTPKPKGGVKVLRPKAAPNTAKTRSLKRAVKRADVSVRYGISKTKADTGDITKGLPVKAAIAARGKKLSDKQTAYALRHPQTSGIPPTVGKALEKQGGDLLKYFGRAGKDIVTLPATVVQSTVETGKAAYDLAAHGDSKKANALLTGIRQHDPLYLAGDAAVKLVSGDTKGAAHSIKKAGNEANAHPGLAAIEVAGAKGATGKGITRAQKLVGKPADLARPVAHLPNSPITSGTRTYSKDFFNRTRIKRQDAKRSAKATALRNDADALDKTNPAAPGTTGVHTSRVTELRLKANKIDPNILDAKAARTRAARSAAAGRNITERNQAAIAGEIRKAIKPSGRRAKPTAAHTLAAQAITDSTAAALKKHRDDIAAGYNALSDTEKVSARETMQQIDKALAGPHDAAQVATAARNFKRIMDPKQQALVDLGVLAPEKMGKAKLVPYAVKHMDGVVAGKNGPVRLVKTKSGERGVPVTAKEITQHMEAAGVDVPAYVAQRPSRAAIASDPLKAPKITGKPRTGASTVKGLADISPQALVDTGTNTQRLVDLAVNYKSHLKEFAHTPSHGNLNSLADAQKLANELHARDGVQYTPVPLDPFKGNSALGDTINGTEPVHAAHAMGEVLGQAYSGAFKHDGKYAIVPKAVADELKAQATSQLPKGNGVIAPTLKGVGSSFRRTVLATSPSWLTGNTVEGALRMAIGGVRPKDKAIFENAVNELAKTDPRAAAELRARTAGGGHYHSADRAQRGDVLAQFEGTGGEAAAQALQRFWTKPTPKLAADAWDKWTHTVFNQLSGRMESSMQASMAGAEIRRSGLIEPGTRKLSAEAAQQAARGLKDTNEQAKLGEAVARMYGRYDGFSADTKYHIANFTPFAAWTYNAANFVLHVLPKDHPTAVLLASVQEKATRDMLKAQGVGKLPDWLKTSIALPGGKHLQFTRYTPFGAFADPGDTAVSAVLPQFMSVYQMMHNGEDWKGKKLRDKDGNPIGQGERFLRGLDVFGQSTVPIYGKIKQVAAKGPGALNPLKPIGPPPAKNRKRKPSSGNSGLILGGGGPGGPDNLILDTGATGGDNLILGSP